MSPMFSRSRHLVVAFVFLELSGAAQTNAPAVQTFTARRPVAEDRRVSRPGRTERPLYQPLRFRRYELAPPDPELIRRAQEDSTQERFRRTNVGIHRPLSLSIHDAQWEQAGPEWRARIAVSSQAALGVRLHLTNIALPPGARLYIYAPDEKQSAMSFLPEDLASGTFWSQILGGDTALLELSVPSTTPEPPRVSLDISEIAHLYVSLVGFGTPSSCEVDASCYPAWSGVGDSVALIYGSYMQTFVCSGVLLNNLAKDYSPIFLTAKHCFSDGITAESAVVFWKYKSSSCNGSVPDYATVPQSLGAELLSMSSSADATLLMLTDVVPADIPFAGWTTAEVALSSPITSVHHPKASFRRYASGPRSADLADYPNHYAVWWSTGIAESGSSGAPGFNTSQQVIGHVSLGSSLCGTRTGPDLFGKFAVAYPDLNQGDILVRGLADDAYAPNFTQETAANLPVPFPKTNLVLKLLRSTYAPDWFSVSVPPYTKIVVTGEILGPLGDILVSNNPQWNTSPWPSPSHISYRAGSSTENFKFGILAHSNGFFPYSLSIDIQPTTAPTIGDIISRVSYANAVSVSAPILTGGLPTTWALEYSTDSNLATYSTSPAFPISVPTGINPSDGDNNQLLVTGMNPVTTYYGRLVASNDQGTTRGSVFTFTTISDIYQPRFDSPTLGFSDLLVGVSSYLTPIIYGGSRIVSTLDNVSVEPPFYIHSYGCTTQLNTCWIKVRFQPMSDGYFRGTLRATAEGVALTMPVYGVGRISPVLSVKTLDWFPYTQLLNTTHWGHLQLSNIGNAPMTISLRPSPNVTAAMDCALSLAPGSSCLVTVSFTPITTGTTWGTVQISTNATICCSNSYSANFYMLVFDLNLNPVRPLRPGRAFPNAPSPPPSVAPLPTSPSADFGALFAPVTASCRPDIEVSDGHRDRRETAPERSKSPGCKTTRKRETSPATIQ